MFEDVGRSTDPHWLRHNTVATLVLGAVFGALWVGDLALRGVISGLAILALEAAGIDPVDDDVAPLDPLVRIHAAEIVEVLLQEPDPVLTPDMLPSAPQPKPKPKPEPEPEPEAPEPEPQPEPAIAEVNADQEVKPDVEVDPDDVTELEADPDEQVAAEQEEELTPEQKRLKEREEIRKGIEEARTMGLLAMDSAGIQIESFSDDFKVDGDVEWDGIFGPRDAHVLVSAMREGRLTQHGQEGGTGGRMVLQMSSFGGGFGGGTMVLRMPPKPEIVKPGKIKFPRKAKKEFDDDVACVVQVRIDWWGQAFEHKIIDCPEPFVEATEAWVYKTTWNQSEEDKPRGGRYTVDFER